MTIAVYPGSFDPITNGHIDVLNRASKLFEHVIIAVLVNPSKKPFLPIDVRIRLIQESISNLDNVEVDRFNGLTVDYAKQKNAKVLIRGLRAVSDFEHEMQMAQMNKTLSNDIETIFLVPRADYNFLSSSLVREVSMFGGNIENMVPEPVNNYLTEYYKER